MPRKCVICRKKTKHGVSLFQFPLKASQNVQNKWKSAGSLPSSYDPNKSECICSDHFKPEEIGKSKLGGKTEKMYLLQPYESFPTVNILTKTRKYHQLDGKINRALF